jgi:hypothetical protein
MEVWKKYQIVNRGMTFQPVLPPGQSYLADDGSFTQMMQPIVQLSKKMSALTKEVESWRVFRGTFIR